MNQISKLFPKADERFVNLICEMLELHSKKIQDYGPISALSGNLTSSQELGIPPHVGVLLRMNDKMRRLKHFVKEGILVNESFEDSLIDLANYSLLCLILYREQRDENSKESARALLTIPEVPTIDLSYHEPKYSVCADCCTEYPVDPYTGDDMFCPACKKKPRNQPKNKPTV